MVSIGRRIMVQASQGKSTRPYLKINESRKGAGDVAQVVECLPRKLKVLILNISTTN
jgi:hypothetical protein